eukprot:jgi/Tetstr1/442159/TSEL_030311.t1
MIWEGRLLAKSMLDFERGWLETHALRELLEFAVGDFDSKLVLRADADISANCEQRVDVGNRLWNLEAPDSRESRHQRGRRLEKKVWKVMEDVPTEMFTFRVELQEGHAPHRQFEAFLQLRAASAAQHGERAIPTHRQTEKMTEDIGGIGRLRGIVRSSKEPDCEKPRCWCPQIIRNFFIACEVCGGRRCIAARKGARSY